MSGSYIPLEIRTRLIEISKNRCEYCCTQALIIDMSLEVEHIVPQSLEGESEFENLCLASPNCNRYKGVRINFLDKETGTIVPLFNPREQKWEEHFRWGSDGIYINGTTPTGRATVEALNMNNTFVVRARRVWVAQGWHPPK